MLQLTIRPIHPRIPEEDDLGRPWGGYSAEKSHDELYRHNRGCWVLGARADQEKYALFSSDDPSGRIVRFAIAIEDIESVGNRRALIGTVLHQGHSVYDKYVDKPSPVSKARNPVTYFDAPEDRRHCVCGCGTPVARGYFVPGHDQRAIHDRVARVGSVVEFLNWFDTHYPEPATTQA